MTHLTYTYGGQLILPFCKCRDVKLCLHHSYRLCDIKFPVCRHYIPRKQIVQDSIPFCKIFITDTSSPWLQNNSLWCLQEKHVLALACRFDRRSMETSKQSMITATFVLNDATETFWHCFTLTFTIQPCNQSL